MARYGHCSACGESVWLAEDGSCPRGHGAEYISGVVDDSAPGAVAGGQAAGLAGAGTQAAGKSNKTVLIVVAVVVMLFLCSCVGLLVAGPLLGLGVPVFNAASEQANERACWANERTMEGALQQWLASDPANSTDYLYDTPSAMAVLVPAYLIQEPLCPAGGYYEFDSYGGTFTCTTHGHY